VNVASDLAFTAMRGYVDYCASKAGLVGLTRGLAGELARRSWSTPSRRARSTPR
jgi:NAD(P)-dependent dehydrogenase (short-subunit alcohol dehydrogenase family)